jgi:hypothetical protein
MPNLPKYVLKYGDPVPRVIEERTLPVSAFCRIMRTWAWARMKPLETDSQRDRDRRKEFEEHWRYIDSKIRKSNLLYRLLYIGEEFRTRPCPKHQGHHGSCVFDAVRELDGRVQKLPRVCECQYEDYITGWLPNEPEGPQQLELFGPPIRQDRSMFIVDRRCLKDVPSSV